MVTSVTSLGKNGLYDWIIQRATAVILGVYFLVIVGYLLGHSDLTFAEWQAFMTCTPMRIFTLISLVSMVAHAWVGLWTVSTDYLTERQMGTFGTVARVAFQLVCGLVAMAYLIWGFQILWGV